MGSLDDINPKTTRGKTPYNLAAKNGHAEVCKLIKKNHQDASKRILGEIHIFMESLNIDYLF